MHLAIAYAEGALPSRHERFGERLSENSEQLYESDNGVLGGPARSAAGGRSGAPETEMAQRRIDFLSLMYKKSSDPGNSPTASRRSDRPCPTRSALARAIAFVRVPRSGAGQAGDCFAHDSERPGPSSRLLPVVQRGSLQLRAARRCFTPEATVLVSTPS
jgi:hypothetical protein